MASTYHAGEDIAVLHNNIYKATNAYLKKHGHVNIHCRNNIASDGRLIVEDRSAAVNNNIDLQDLLEASSQPIEENKNKKNSSLVTIQIP